MRGHSLPGPAHPLASNSLRHLQSLRVHPIPQDGRVSGGRYLKVVGGTSPALTNSRESPSIGARHSKSADFDALRTASTASAGAATMTTQSTTCRTLRARPSGLTFEHGFISPSLRVGTSVLALRGSLNRSSGSGTSTMTWP